MPARAARKMPKWTKAPDELVALFAKLVAAAPGAQTRQMFGYPAAFVNGYLFAGVFQDRMFLRLSAGERVAFLTMAGAAPFEPMPGRVMRDYVVVPPALLKSPPRMRGWLDKAWVYAKALPPKVHTRRKG